MSWLDRLMGRSAPQVGASASSGNAQETRWRGASRALRSLVNWRPVLGSAATDMPANEQRTLRARSRDAMRSHTIARAAIMRPRTNIVGTGLMCRPQIDHKVLGLTPEEAEVINADVQRRYEAWAEDPVQCDAEATLDIYGQQGLTLMSAMLSGDVFVLTPQEDRGGTSTLKLQLIEADRVCNKDDAQNTETLIDGIEIGALGRPVACFIRSTHPGDTTTAGIPTWTRYQFFGDATGRRRVLHIWNDKERPGQVRGAPFLAPILEPLKQLERFGSAELMAAVMSAMLTFFIEQADPKFDPVTGSPLDGFAGMSGADPGTSTAPPTISVGEGAVVSLAPGEKPHMANPARPNANFDPFFMSVVKSIGAALELPVDELMLNYQSSYSAARAAMLQAWRFYLLRRWALVQQFCAPVYGLWFDEEVASGRISAPGYSDPLRRKAWTRALWIGPARGAMDEDKEAKAAKARIEAGVSNETIETMQLTGEDWQTVNAQRAREIASRKANGTWVEPQQAQRATASQPIPDPAQEEAA